jgi:hypothetical protein
MAEEKRADEPLPTKKFNDNSFQFCYIAYFKKDARKRANKLNNQGNATKISKHSNNPNKRGKPYFIVWRR